LLAWRLGMTPAALYERQRELVRQGILSQSEGRGPGSGVHASPYSVALLLVSVLATDSLSETAEKARIFAPAKSTATDGHCPLTGQRTFVEAVALLLDMTRQHWRKIVNVTLDRTTRFATIKYKDDLSSGDSVFAIQIQAHAKLPAPTKLIVHAILRRDLIIEIARDLKKIAESEQRDRAAALQPIGHQWRGRISRRELKTVRVNSRRLKKGKKR
jgi:hypothetical protein